MNTLRLFRGLAVPAARRDEVIEKITVSGFVGGEGHWNILHQHPGDIDALFERDDLTSTITRASGATLPKVVCACGDLDGATYYACSHNRTAKDDTPIIVEFDAPLSDIAIDGRDFLYTVFQFGQLEVSREALLRSFGPRILRYADKAQATGDQSKRIALCDLAIHDPAVIEAHHGNQVVIAGRHHTVFKSAFTVVCPVGPDRISSITSPSERFVTPQAEISLNDLTRR